MTDEQKDNVSTDDKEKTPETKSVGERLSELKVGYEDFTAPEGISLDSKDPKDLAKLEKAFEKFKEEKEKPAKEKGKDDASKGENDTEGTPSTPVEVSEVNPPENPNEVEVLDDKGAKSKTPNTDDNDDWKEKRKEILQQYAKDHKHTEVTEDKSQEPKGGQYLNMEGTYWKSLNKNTLQIGYEDESKKSKVDIYDAAANLANKEGMRVKFNPQSRPEFNAKLIKACLKNGTDMNLDFWGALDETTKNNPELAAAYAEAKALAESKNKNNSEQKTNKNQENTETPKTEEKKTLIDKLQDHAEGKGFKKELSDTDKEISRVRSLRIKKQLEDNGLTEEQKKMQKLRGLARGDDSEAAKVAKAKLAENRKLHQYSYGAAKDDKDKEALTTTGENIYNFKIEGKDGEFQGVIDKNDGKIHEYDSKKGKVGKEVDEKTLAKSENYKKEAQEIQKRSGNNEK